LTLWNPTVHTIVNHVRVPVTRTYAIRGPAGDSLLVDVRNTSLVLSICYYCSVYFTEKILPISQDTMSIPGRKSFAKFELVFNVILPPLGYNTYFFQVEGNCEYGNHFFHKQLSLFLVESDNHMIMTENMPCVLQNQVQFK
jgi:hypothetical protein